MLLIDILKLQDLKYQPNQISWKAECYYWQHPQPNIAAGHELLQSCSPGQTLKLIGFVVANTTAFTQLTRGLRDKV